MPRLRLAIRFTPTRVGKSTGATQVNATATVHPHTCGEILRPLTHNPQRRGSPPHVWGNRSSMKPQRRPGRFTPTRVGKSGTGVSSPRFSAVHPHTCGEILLGSLAYTQKNGSPPHVWGNLAFRSIITAASRFTPTRVGKSSLIALFIYNFTVHPHTCGEIYQQHRLSQPTTGSPPHVWGNLTLSRLPLLASRFTPTRVGKSSLPPAPVLALAVHPHTCGEIFTYVHHSPH